MRDNSVTPCRGWYTRMSVKSFSLRVALRESQASSPFRCNLIQAFWSPVAVSNFEIQRFFTCIPISFGYFLMGSWVQIFIQLHLFSLCLLFFRRPSLNALFLRPLPQQLLRRILCSNSEVTIVMLVVGIRRFLLRVFPIILAVALVVDAKMMISAMTGLDKISTRHPMATVSGLLELMIGLNTSLSRNGQLRRRKSTRVTVI